MSLVQDVEEVVGVVGRPLAFLSFSLPLSLALDVQLNFAILTEKALGRRM